MKKRFCLKKACVIVSAAAFLAAGMPGLSTVTAWALPGTATVLGEQVNVRSSPVDGTVIDVVVSGKQMDVIDSTTGSDGMTWYEVSYTSNGIPVEGWIRSDLLDAVDEEAQAAEQAAAEQAAQEEAEKAAAEEAAAQAAAEQAAAEQAAEEEAAAKAAEEAVATSEGGITYVIASTIPASVVPEGYRKTTVNYEGKEIQGLVMEAADVCLLYMEDASGTAEGRFVVYDIDKAELIPYICFDTEDGFILLLNIPDAELASVSDRFAKATCEFETGTMDALQMVGKDSVISDSAELSNFYYMYGVNQDGAYGWYVYDRNADSIQENVLSMHYNLNGTTVEAVEEEPAFSLDSLSMIVIVGFLVILLLLVILVIVFGIRYRQLAKEYDAMANGSGKKNGGDDGGKGGRRAKKRSRDREEEEDDFYFDEEEEEDDDAVFGRSRTEGVARAAQPDTRSSRKVSQATQNFDFAAEKERILNEAPAAAKPEARTETPRVSPPAKPSAVVDDDDDDLEFL